MGEFATDEAEDEIHHESVAGTVHDLAGEKSGGDSDTDADEK